MIVPMAGRIVAAILGGLLVISAARSMIGTIIVPRPARGWLTRSVDWLVNSAFRLATFRVTSYRRLDRVLAGQAPVILLAQLIAWLVIFFVGYSLLIWPFVHAGITSAFNTAGPALWFIGNSQVSGAGERTIQDIASVTGLITITLQIAYLPTLYSAFNRRETDLALLNARAGVPSGKVAATYRFSGSRRNNAGAAACFATSTEPVCPCGSITVASPECTPAFSTCSVSA